MADFTDEDKRKLDEMHTAIVEQQTLMNNVVVNKAECETKRGEIYDTIRDCQTAQCEKIEKSGRVSKMGILIATAIGGMVTLAIVLLTYLITRG